MRYYPVCLDIKNKKCLVVGGGMVGTRKVITLLDCGADVTVASLVFTENLLQLSESGKVVLKKSPYLASDLQGVFLVIGATDDNELNLKISADAMQLNILCNIVDQPQACNFILPAVVNRGDLVIAISTSGKSPAFAKKLRKDLEKEFGQEYGDFLLLMGAIRKKLLSKSHQHEAHKHLFEELIKKRIVELIKKRKIEDINRLLFEIFGKGYEFNSLMQAARMP